MGAWHVGKTRVVSSVISCKIGCDRWSLAMMLLSGLGADLGSGSGVLHRQIPRRDSRYHGPTLNHQHQRLASTSASSQPCRGTPELSRHLGAPREFFLFFEPNNMQASRRIIIGAPWARHCCRATPPPRTLPLAIRHFSATRHAGVKTTEMTESDLGAVKVDQSRLMDTLHNTCGFGTGQRWGRQDQPEPHFTPLTSQTSPRSPRSFN